jgi:hypothetical protein
MMIERVVCFLFKWVHFMDESNEISLKIIVLFLFEYINIMVGLLVSSESWGGGSSKAESLGLSLKFVSPDFYIKTGSKVIMLNFLGVFLPPLLTFARLLIARGYNEYRSRLTAHQNKNLKVNSYEEFDIEGNYVSFLTTLATAITFSSAMPILMIFATISVLFSFWTQKYILVSHSKQPIFQSATIIRVLVMTLPLMLVCHLVFSVSVFGDWSIFMDEKGKSIWQSFLVENELPLFDEDMLYRLQKNVLLVSLCGVFFLLLIFGEIIYNLFFHQVIIERIHNKRPEGDFEYYSKCLGYLRSQSAVDYDFRKLPQYSNLFPGEVSDRKLSMETSREELTASDQDEGEAKLQGRGPWTSNSKKGIRMDLG